jgi:hypothetical protein
MGRSGVVRQTTVTLGVACTAVSLVAAGPAHASPDWGLNGVFTATSNGEWAKTNDIYHDEASVRANWSIATSCSYSTECAGTVSTDAGWSATIYQKSGLWYVKRTVPGWQPCPDGPAADGLQEFKFWPAAPDGSVDPQSSTLVGVDHTVGPSGACGKSLPLAIVMPFKLVKVAQR